MSTLHFAKVLHIYQKTSENTIFFLKKAVIVCDFKLFYYFCREKAEIR